MRNSALQEWGSLISDYSLRGFTHPGDRMIALGSMEPKFRQFDLGPYLYGLWRGETFPTQLACVAFEREIDRKRVADLHTWSWASIYGECRRSAHAYADPDIQLCNVCEVVKLPTDASGPVSARRTIVISSLAVCAKIRPEEPEFHQDYATLQVKAEINDETFNISEDICHGRKTRLNGSTCITCRPGCSLLETINKSGDQRELFILRSILAGSLPIIPGGRDIQADRCAENPRGL